MTSARNAFSSSVCVGDGIFDVLQFVLRPAQREERNRPNCGQNADAIATTAPTLAFSHPKTLPVPSPLRRRSRGFIGRNTYHGPNEASGARSPGATPLTTRPAFLPTIEHPRPAPCSRCTYTPAALACSRRSTANTFAALRLPVAAKFASCWNKMLDPNPPPFNLPGSVTLSPPPPPEHWHRDPATPR